MSLMQVARSVAGNIQHGALGASIIALCCLQAGCTTSSETYASPGFQILNSQQAYYPKAAEAKKIAGGALIECQSLAQARAQDCNIDYEAPEGWGFGAAAMKFVQETKWYESDGRPISGRHIWPICFQVKGSWSRGKDISCGELLHVSRDKDLNSR